MAWEFNEWLHGETGHPMGYALQAWSAGMYLFAHHAVKTGEVPLFDALHPRVSDGASS
jgi:glycogen debranching enzyme